jgi:hypothetical protein
VVVHVLRYVCDSEKESTTMTKLFLISSLLVALFAGCAGEMVDNEGLATEEQIAIDEQELVQEQPADFAAVVSAIPDVSPHYICRGLKSACCEPIGKTPDGKYTICQNKIHCVQNPISCN